MHTFKNKDGKTVLLKIVKAIQDNKAYLSEVDGLIGDGDHGTNMNKGFSVFENRYKGQDFTFTEGLYNLGVILMNEIGGSMGPIYGTIFMEMSDLEDLEEIQLDKFINMLKKGLEGLNEIVEARVGDKTLVDTLAPAIESLIKAQSDKLDFIQALQNMKIAAVEGRDTTKELVAKFGRSSRLGERSRGVLDAGAVSCCIILTAMADGMMELISKEYC